MSPQHDYMDAISVGIIGGGAIAEAVHLPQYKANDSSRVVALAEPIENRRRELREAFDISRTYTDGETMLSREDLDVVSICSPPHTHATLVELAVKHGVDIYCEKPFTTHLTEAMELKDLIEAEGAVVQVGYTLRYYDSYRRALKMIENGLLGQVTMVNTVYHGQPPESDWYYDQESAGGGVISDFGPHIFDIYLDLFDQPLDVDSSRVTGRSDVETGAEIQLHAGDTSITTSLRWTRKSPFHQTTFVGSEGVLRLDQQSIEGRVQGEEIEMRGGELPTVDVPGIYKSWFGSKGKPEYSRIDDFVDNVLRGDPETTVPVSRAVDVGSLKKLVYEAANDA